MGGDLPPAITTVQVDTEASATVSEDPPAPPEATYPYPGQANNGYGDPYQFYDGNRLDPISMGSHIEQRNSSSGDFTVEVQPSVSGSTSSQYPNSAYVGCDISITVNAVNASINSDTEISYFKGGDGGRGAHVNPSDDKSLESVVELGPTGPNVEGWTFGGDFDVLTNGWTDSCMWNYAGPGGSVNGAPVLSSLTGTQTHLSLDFGSSDDIFPVTGTVQATATNSAFSNSVIGPLKCHMIWHLPYENWHSYKPEQDEWVTPSLTIPDPGHAYYNSGITVHWLKDPTMWGEVGLGGNVAGIFSVLSNLAPNKLWAGLFAVAGVAGGTLDPTQEEATPMFDDSAWDNQNSIFVDTPADNSPATKWLYYMVPVFHAGYHVNFYEADAYDHHGFSGLAHKAIRKFYSAYWTGEFHKIDPSPNNGP